MPTIVAIETRYANYSCFPLSTVLSVSKQDLTLRFILHERINKHCYFCLAVQKAAMPGVMPHDIIDLDYDLMDGEVEFDVVGLNEVGLNEVELNEVEGVFDSVCAFCDDGGEILCCEGRCMRLFHATVEAGANMCPSLGFSLGELHGLPRFVCKNCECQQHQCFACGKLGSSDVFSGAEVFPCISATCNYFYHPHCVAKLLYRENKAAAEELERNIVAGGYFTCPIHKCCVCKQGENKEDSQLQFAVCRRCPKSYHRKCLPRAIAFEDIEEGIITRAWEGLLPDRALIFCLNHEIVEELGAPLIDHIKFPGD